MGNILSKYKVVKTNADPPKAEVVLEVTKKSERVASRANGLITLIPVNKKYFEPSLPDKSSPKVKTVTHEKVIPCILSFNLSELAISHCLYKGECPLSVRCKEILNIDTGTCKEHVENRKHWETFLFNRQCVDASHPFLYFSCREWGAEYRKPHKNYVPFSGGYETIFIDHQKYLRWTKYYHVPTSKIPKVSELRKEILSEHHTLPVEDFKTLMDKSRKGVFKCSV